MSPRKNTLIVIGLMMLMITNIYANNVNGRNVTSVVFSAGGEPIGAYRQETRDKWTEHQQDKTFSFVERGRDDWSVYLYDQSRDTHIQLDLQRNKVGYKQGNNPKADLYNIVKSESVEFDTRSQSAAPAASPATSAINGLNTIQVLYNAGSGPAGAYTLVARKKWSENSKFSFDEKGRDVSSVYLFDASRNIHIQLDLQRNKVIYSQGNGARSDLYNIVSVR